MEVAGACIYQRFGLKCKIWQSFCGSKAYGGHGGPGLAIVGFGLGRVRQH